MIKPLLVVSAVVVSLAGAGLGLAFGCDWSSCPLCDHGGAPAAAVAPGEVLPPSEPVHAMFKGCQSACGSKAEADAAQAHVQPGVAEGDFTFCPVSGAVFRVSAESTKRTVGGKPLFFCCDACAGYFDKAPADVLAKRGLEPLS